MAAKKQVVSDEDKKRVLYALSSTMSDDGRLEAVQVGWKCHNAGTHWAETVLESLLVDNLVVKERLITKAGRDVEHEPFTWRLP
jgi:hypothetical protein